jgi:uncharacterized protein YjbI with pentapeptide repeats
MANEKHLRILKQGTGVWNQWREEHEEIKPDLRGVELGEAELQEGNFSCTDFSGADLTEADLSGADLTGAKLSRANLAGVNLVGADLSQAEMMRTNLTGATLYAANLSKAILHQTVFANTDLSKVSGLDEVNHAGPSTIGIDTFFNSKGKIPEIFLRGAGLPELFVQYSSSMTGTTIEFYSCFISYSHANKSFARRLHDALQWRGIRCWLDEKQLLPGDHIHQAIDEGIRVWDKVLLCCSQASLTSWWVDKEIQKALMKEETLWKQRGRQVLAIIPLNLDGYMLNPQWVDWKKQHLKTRLAADFTCWENDNSKFEEQFELVVQALRADANAREKPPEPRL